MAEEHLINAKHILHSGIFNSTLRKWHSVNYSFQSGNFMYPVFLIENDDDQEAIDSMPGVFRYGINRLRTNLTELVNIGLKSVLLFGVINTLPKDDQASNADSALNPVVRVLPKLKQWFPNLTVACDVCLCPYTANGHCGFLLSSNNCHIIDNAASVLRLAEIALVYARAGADIVAPSDMMDGRVGAIKRALIGAGLGNRVAVMSYAAKFASQLYGPFRGAVHSTPISGDRSCHQLPAAAKGLALRAVRRDIEEGADFVMVKPALAYLDIIRDVKQQFPDWPLAAYQVSGEYAMIECAHRAGALNRDAILNEVFTSLRRAGADIIISYFTPVILRTLFENNENI